MAGYPPPGGYPPPNNTGYPSYPGYPAPAPAVGATGQSTVVVQQTKVQQKPAKGLLGSLKSGASKVGTQIGKEINYCSNKITQAVDSHATGAMLDLFKSGNVVQLVSRASGRCLQIVSLPDNKLVIDGHGPSDPKAFFTHWKILNEGGNQIRLYNNNNYLAIINGLTCLVPGPSGPPPPPGQPLLLGLETKFQLTQSGQFILLESMKERQRHIGVLPNGALKPAVATGREDHAQFGVNVIFNAPPTADVTKVHR